ncbi:MAG TPA: DUF87 domain-containing protein, partial [Gammaproteobacteria bacterium]|nr:DUF87 domain-containing protein [Gammaproteobacteria bacterium]
MYREEFKTLLAKLKPVIGDLADALWLSTLLDPSRRKDVEAVALALAAELLEESYTGKHVLLEPPPARIARGEYPLGTVMYAGKAMEPFGLRESDLPQHLLIAGRSGAGKTNIGYLLVRTFLQAGKPFIVLDWRKNYRPLCGLPGGENIQCFPLGQDESLAFNPLQPPPDLSPAQQEAYLRDVISVICTTYLPGHQLLTTHGVEYLFLQSLDALTTTTGKPPTFNDIRGYLEKYKARSREHDWKVSARNVLYRLTTGNIGRLCNTPSSVTPADILTTPVILEMDSLGNENDRNMFVRTFLLWLYYHRLTEPKSPSSKHVLVIEEAHHLFLRRQHDSQSLFNSMVRQFRDLGQGLVLMDQNPSLLSVPALGNTGTSIILNLKHSDDLAAAGKALSLPPDDWDTITRLPVGSAIVKVQNRWPKPFLVQFPYFPLPGPEKPSIAESRHLNTDSVQQRVQEARSVVNEAIRAVRAGDRRDKKTNRISDQERRFLQDIADHPLSTMTERYDRLNWSPYTGTKIKRKLLEKGIIQQENIRIPQGSVTLL